MKSAITKILVTFGVIFVLLMLAGIYFYVADPMGFKPMIFGTKSTELQGDNSNTTASGFQLSEAQKQALVAAGIDSSKVPTSVSAAQETCFAAALGNAKVAEIKAGAVPSAMEFLKAKSCI